jgi:hypothetical protein
MRNRLMDATQDIQFVFSKIAILLKNRKKTTPEVPGWPM